MTDVDRERPNVNYGDHELALNNEILRTLVGSGVHGIAIDGTDDRDEMGVFIEPPEHVIGGKGPYDTHQWRTQPEGARSGPGDTDLTIYCHAPESRVLTADLRWVAIASLGVGDRIVSFDEREPTRARHRHFSTGTVLATETRLMERLRVYTSEGPSVVTPEHPFLIRQRRNTKAEWRRAVDLRPGDPIYAVPTWDRDASWEAGYLAGQFDGDGCLHFTRTKDGCASQLAWTQKTGRPDVPYVEGMLSERGFKTRTHGPTASGCAAVHIADSWVEQMRFLGSMRPTRLLAHPELERLWETRSLQGCGRAIVEAVEPLPPGDMVAMEVDTRTYVADGLLSHNSLRKYLKLATRGNPTILLPLFARDRDLLMVSTLGMELRALTPSIVSQRAPRRFLGYLTQQEERLLGGGKRNRVPVRPELVAAHGYDTKYASHAIRLGLQGVELATTGRLSLPMTSESREVCLRVKRGEVPFEEALALVRASRAKLERIIDEGRSPLPPGPDWAAVDGWAIGAHRRHWGWT